MLQDDAGTHVQAFSAAQLAGLGSLSASTYKTVFVTAQLFFGTWSCPLGYLVYKSRHLPRFLGVLLLADGVAVMIWFLQALLFPALSRRQHACPRRELSRRVRLGALAPRQGCEAGA
jgi:hypothetical protein